VKKKLLLEFTNGAWKTVVLEPHSGSNAFTWSSVNKCTKYLALYIRDVF